LLFFKEWIDAGFTYISDVFQDGKFIKPTYLLNKLTAKQKWITQYSKLQRAIPKLWKEILATGYNINTKTNFAPQIYTCKNLYWELVNDKAETSYAPMIWNHVIGINPEWETIWTFKIKNMPVKKIAQFNYYLLHDKIPHKQNLRKWKISVTDVCDDCSMLENCLNYMYECKRVKTYWDKISTIFSVILGLKFEIKLKHIICGHALGEMAHENQNIIIMVAAFAIYKTKILKHKYFEHVLTEELCIINRFKNNTFISDFIKYL